MNKIRTCARARFFFFKLLVKVCIYVCATDVLTYLNTFCSFTITNTDNEHTCVTDEISTLIVASAHSLCTNLTAACMCECVCIWVFFFILKQRRKLKTSPMNRLAYLKLWNCRKGNFMKFLQGMSLMGIYTKSLTFPCARNAKKFWTKKMSDTENNCALDCTK